MLQMSTTMKKMWWISFNNIKTGLNCKLCDLNDKRPLLRSKSFFWSNSVVPQYSWLSFKEIFSLWQFNSPSLPRFSSNLFFTFMNSVVNAFSKNRYILFFTKQSSFHSSFPIFAKDTSTVLSTDFYFTLKSRSLWKSVRFFSAYCRADNWFP